MNDRDAPAVAIAPSRARQSSWPGGSVVANLSMSLDGFVEKGWGGHHPTGAPVFVVTHHPPTDYPYANCTFVSGGVAAAIEAARAVAGDKNVAVASADITRQCLDLGLLDAVMVDLVPVILGTGRPLLAGVADTINLEDPVITAGQGVTHLYYAVRN
jgi:dihydrofolate reductase